MNFPINTPSYFRLNSLHPNNPFKNSSFLSVIMLFYTLALAATYSLLVSGSVIPAEKRQTPASCSVYASGNLIVRPKDNTSSGLSLMQALFLTSNILELMDQM